MGLLLIFLLFCVSTPSAIFSQTHETIEEREPKSRTVIDLKGNPESVVWVVQLSDLHFSVFNPDRALDFKKFVGPALAMINPSLVLITGDLTDGKSKDLLTMKQGEEEWKEYQNVIEDVVRRSGLDKKIFYDLRGNHDNFGVPVLGGPFDFFSKYSINGRQRRRGNVHSITLKSGGRKHLFVGFDSTMAIGLRGPTNLFGHPTDQLVAELENELSQWDNKSSEPVVKISFGHFPLSFTANTDSGKNMKDAFLKHSLSAYLCGHLHTRFGKNLKRKHHSGNRSFPTEKFFQYNIHQTSVESNMYYKNCVKGAQPVKEFWEWEMGDWRKSRVMRVLAIDEGHISFLDIDFKSEAKKTIILPTFPLDSRFMLTASYIHDYNCHSMGSLSSETVRALVFSTSVILSVVARVYDSRWGNLDLVMESSMTKFQNSTRGDLYTVLWNWKAFEDPSPDRYWLQIEATDIMGRSTTTELRPFSLNGVSLKLSWTWKEFLVMGCQWATLYYPMLWSVLVFLFTVLVVSKALLSCSKICFSYKNFRNKKGFTSGLLWILTELSAIFPVWLGMLLYLIYLISFPWFFGKHFSEGGNRGYMTYKGWTFNSSSGSDKQAYLGHPDVMVIVLPHLCFVVLPALLVTGALAAERAVYREHYLLLSGKKEDDYDQANEKVSQDLQSNKKTMIFSGRRWVHKLLIVVCLAILFKHWKNCRAMMKAYEMNPSIDFPVYCLSVPLLLIYATWKTMGV